MCFRSEKVVISREENCIKGCQVVNMLDKEGENIQTFQQKKYIELNQIIIHTLKSIKNTLTVVMVIRLCVIM